MSQSETKETKPAKGRLIASLFVLVVDLLFGF